LPTSASRSSKATAAALRPRTGSNFLVDLGMASPRAEGGGFSDVVFPTFRVDPADTSDGASPHLLLSRAATGALDLHDWWQQARRGKASRGRVVKVMLLDDDQRTVVWTWRFRNARPVSLTYSPLRAMEPAILMETIALAFDDVEIA
jgi:phage tail-like protein